MSDTKFRRLIAVLIAVATVFAAVIAQLQTEAGDRDDRASRDAKRASVEAFGLQVRGAAEANYNYYTAYEQYRELDTLRDNAEKQGDEKAAARYEAIRDGLIDTSPLLSGKDSKGEAYFDPESAGQPDIDRFEAESYVREVERLMQVFRAASVVKDAWDYKSNTYIVHLTLLAVAVFLFGLAGTVATHATRGIFTTCGCVIAVVAVAWAVQTWASPVVDLRQRGKAIDHYARARALQHMDRAEEAVAEFQAAIADYSAYTDAYLELGRALQQQEESDVAGALASLQKARQLDPTNDQVLLEIAWCQFQLGQLPEAVATGRQGVQVRPDDLQTRFLLGLSLLASGQNAEAKAEYQKGMEHAARVVAELNKGREGGEVLASPEVIAALEEASVDLDGLVEALDEGQGTPPPDKVANPEQVSKDAEELSIQLVSWELALENTGKPPEGPLAARLEDLAFQDLSSGKAGPDAETFSGEIAQVQLSFDYSGMKDGQQVTYRFFLEDRELDSWRWNEKWTGGAEGEWEEPIYPGYSDTFRFEPGTYTVEIFVDYHFATAGTFTVEE
ncbi:MAG: tetratricopeptide repeat protein [Candidatus Eremiobacterota bacterium]